MGASGLLAHQIEMPWKFKPSHMDDWILSGEASNPSTRRNRKLVGEKEMGTK